MERYRDSAGNSGIAAYDIAKNSIRVEFKDGGLFLYDTHSPGRAEIEEMKRLARAGSGLNTFINRYVRGRYAAKLR